MKVVVLTTSYPRDERDPSGSFVAAGVRAAESRGIEIEVVSPASFPGFGLAYGAGIVQNLRVAPWKLALVPPFLAAYAMAARRAARGADLVHAHWIPSALAARATGCPYVLQIWGTDVELARRAPALTRPLVRGASTVIVASRELANAAAALGARRVEIVPTAVELPHVGAVPEEPRHVLFAGRLSEEKGILEFLEATEGLPRVVVGDGPLRRRVPEAVGFVPPAEMAPYYERAAVVCVPSRREGYGMVAREAMAHGRAVVVTAVGGLPDAVEDGVTGLLVPPRDTAALRRAVAELLVDPDRSARLGAAARRWTARELDPAVFAGHLERVYEGAQFPPR